MFHFRYILNQNSVKVLFFARSNAFHILNQCIKVFQMSYQQPLYALFHHHPGPPGLNPPGRDPPKFYYLSDP